MKQGKHHNRRDGSLCAVTRMFCPECKELKDVTDTNPYLSKPVAWLSCGHTRTNYLPRTEAA